MNKSRVTEEQVVKILREADRTLPSLLEVASTARNDTDIATGHNSNYSFESRIVLVPSSSAEVAVRWADQLPPQRCPLRRLIVAAIDPELPVA